jgi:hypothetical protein
VARKQSEKPFAESFSGGNHIDVLADVTELLIELHAREKAAMSEAQQVRRIVRRIERLIREFPYALSTANGDSNDDGHDGDSHAQCERNRAIERSNLVLKPVRLPPKFALVG